MGVWVYNSNPTPIRFPLRDFKNLLRMEEELPNPCSAFSQVTRATQLLLLINFNQTHHHYHHQFMAASPPTQKKTIILKSSDNHTYKVEEEAILQSQTIKHLVEDGCADNAIPLANVEGKVLGEVIEYCKKHVKEKDSDALKAWDAKFMDVDQKTLYDRIMAANYLDVKSLLDLCCQKVADAILVRGRGSSSQGEPMGFRVKALLAQESCFRIAQSSAYSGFID